MGALRWVFFLMLYCFFTTTELAFTPKRVSPRLPDVCLFIYIQSYVSGGVLCSNAWLTLSNRGCVRSVNPPPNPHPPTHTDATNLKPLVVRATQHSGIHYFILGFIPHEINSSALTLRMTSKGFCRRQRNKITLTPFVGGGVNIFWVAMH